MSVDEKLEEKWEIWMKENIRIKETEKYIKIKINYSKF